MNSINKFISKNPKLALWGTLIGTFVVVIAGILIFQQGEKKQMETLQQQFPNWIEMTGTLKPFKALFPVSPQSEVSDLPLPGSDQVAKQEVFAASPSETEDYYLSAIVYSASVENTDKDKLSDDLRKALDGMMSTQSGAKLISSRIDVSLEGPRSIEFVIENPSSQGFLKGRLMIVKDTMYQIWIDSKGQELDDKYKYFINSFSPAQ